MPAVGGSHYRSRPLHSPGHQQPWGSERSPIRRRSGHRSAVTGFAAGFGGKVFQRPLDEVLAELEAQEEAAREADKAARKAIHEQKKQERTEDFQTRVDALKAKFHKE